MRLPSYPEYQDSGVEWLGEIPTTWSVKRIKQTTYLKGRVGWKGLTSDEYLEDGYAYLVTGTDFSKKFINWNDCHCIEKNRYEDDPYIQLRDGDLLITKDGTIGKLALVAGLDRPACLNSGIFLIRPTSSYLTEYMYWVLQSNAFKVFCDLSSLGSTIQHLYQNVFEDFSFPVPSSHEQTGIAKFLDRETAKIDTLIAKQEKLLTLLAEKRQATISHAVTKGLNPDVPMKDSGVEWLGEVPEHWKVVPLMHLTYPSRPIMYGIVLPGPDVESGIPIVKGGDVKEHRLKVELLNRTTVEIEAPFARARLKPMDIVYSIRGTIGDAEVVPEELKDANITQDVARISPAESIQTRWLLHVMKSKPVFTQLEQRSLGAAVRGINIFELKRARIPVPPSSERDRIAKHLDELTIRLDALKAESESNIRLLQERRSALISAAVTGQIDVRTTQPTPELRIPLVKDSEHA